MEEFAEGEALAAGEELEGGEVSAVEDEVGDEQLMVESRWFIDRGRLLVLRRRFAV